jgi:hypothetical protein
MTLSAQLHAFYRDVAASWQLWAIRMPDGGYVQWTHPNGKRVLPVWSTESRLNRTMRHLSEINGGVPHAIGFESFCAHWLPDLVRTSVSLGINWTGPQASGAELPPAAIVESVLAVIKRSVGKTANPPLNRTRRKRAPARLRRAG